MTTPPHIPKGPQQLSEITPKPQFQPTHGSPKKVLTVLTILTIGAP